MQHIYIIDGDMSLDVVSKCIDACGYWNSPIVFRVQEVSAKPPKKLSDKMEVAEFDYVPICLTRAGKESVDKAILVTIQKLISAGVKEITVFAQDQDFQLDSLFILNANSEYDVKINIIFPFVKVTQFNAAYKIDPRIESDSRISVNMVDVSKFRTIQNQIEYATR